MQREFWESRWSEGVTPWHADAVNPILVEHLDRLIDRAGARVLVPLCGKSVDLWWLAEQGHAPIGVELVEEAVRVFFAEAGVEPERDGDRWSGGGVEIWASDIFAVDADAIGPIDAVWDRAALIALPPDWHRRYVDAIGRLAPRAPVLLSTVFYDTAVMEGPPFAVSPEHVQALYPDPEVVHRQDIVEGSRWAELGHRWFESISYVIGVS